MGSPLLTVPNVIVDGWAVTFGIARAGLQPTQAPLCCNKCNRPAINGQCRSHRIAVQWSNALQFLLRDAMYKRGLCCHAVSICLSVCLSVTSVSCDKTNKDIFEILVFPYQTGWRYSNGNPHNGGVECKGV